MPSAVTRFVGRHAYLSNFYHEDVGRTVEHRFQSAKTLVPDEREWVLESPVPSVAKRRGRRVTLRADWEEVKDDVMLSALREKFSDAFLADLLLSTGDAELVEGNTWGDTYWGVDTRTGKGKNMLGVLLMRVRGELREAEDGKSRRRRD